MTTNRGGLNGQALVGSLILHLLALFFVSRAPVSTPPTPPASVEISILPPEALQPQRKSQKQIVSPPAERDEKPEVPEAERFQSDRDNTVVKQQLRRGAGEDAAPIVSKVRGEPRPPAPKSDPAPQQQPKRAAPQREPKPEPDEPKREPKPPQKAESPKARSNAPAHLKTLSLDSATTMAKFGEEPPEQREKSERSKNAAVGSSPRPFSRPQGSGAAFFGNQGSLDLLPSLPDGDITLLNTKANQFAVFVRRVALQVFAQLRASGWERLSASDINRIGRDTVIRASLTPKGNLMGVSIQIESGNERFDSVVVDAAKKGARDPNPPPGAFAADGNIHFIFQARSWSQPASNARTGAQSERRWLMLATGLE